MESGIDSLPGEHHEHRDESQPGKEGQEDIGCPRGLLETVHDRRAATLKCHLPDNRPIGLGFSTRTDTGDSWDTAFSLPA